MAVVSRESACAVVRSLAAAAAAAAAATDSVDSKREMDSNKDRWKPRHNAVDIATSRTAVADTSNIHCLEPPL